MIVPGKGPRMTNRLASPPLTTLPAGTRIAAYADLRGAARAVHHLRERGVHIDGVQVRPRHVRSVDGALATVPAEPRRRVGVGGGVLVGAIIVLLLGWDLGGALLAIALGALGGGVAYWLDDVVLRWRARRAAAAASTLKVGHFEILCSRDPGAAEHELATWWDPTARPVPVERAESRRERPARVLTAA